MAPQPEELAFLQSLDGRRHHAPPITSPSVDDTLFPYVSRCAAGSKVLFAFPDFVHEGSFGALVSVYVKQKLGELMVFSYTRN
uniref:Uncharacterized protein n=1 Tax=Oryza punctata TaxID=4537 RepID=A0A0E0M025_ORYPU